MHPVHTHSREVESERDSGQGVGNEWFSVKRWQIVPGGRGTYVSQTILRTVQKAFRDGWFREPFGPLRV